MDKFREEFEKLIASAGFNHLDYAWFCESSDAYVANTKDEVCICASLVLNAGWKVWIKRQTELDDLLTKNSVLEVRIAQLELQQEVSTLRNIELEELNGLQGITLAESQKQATALNQQRDAAYKIIDDLTNRRSELSTTAWSDLLLCLKILNLGELIGGEVNGS